MSHRVFALDASKHVYTAEAKMMGRMYESKVCRIRGPFLLLKRPRLNDWELISPSKISAFTTRINCKYPGKRLRDTWLHVPSTRSGFSTLTLISSCSRSSGPKIPHGFR